MKCSKITILFILSFIFFTCGTTKQVKYDVIKFSQKKNDSDNINKYLVAIDSYTTNGVKYHKKYEKYLRGVANILLHEKKVDIAAHSIGFYFDKKSGAKNKLYFGLDVNERNVLKKIPYEKNGRIMLKKYLLTILEVLHSCIDILKEKEIDGMVIGINWQAKEKQFLNIWIKKKYVQKYYDKKLTFHELVYNCFITNKDGKIIRITL